MPAAVRKTTKEPTKAHCRQPNLVWRSNDRFGIEQSTSFYFRGFLFTTNHAAGVAREGYAYGYFLDTETAGLHRESGRFILYSQNEIGAYFTSQVSPARVIPTTTLILYLIKNRLHNTIQLFSNLVKFLIQIQRTHHNAITINRSIKIWNKFLCSTSI